ncbi:hypothetical protein FH972_020404 [Carpinus fangiana]|uniref:Trichome birefringence-like C-terminal domain-containing protein n=1 Tax=Carpinus fangiana TaxID=176857 RepID=A0A5N6RWA6_9ROSI|nr:hypothetical protein FH972_020404 [Carpinus fangiana]
MGQKQPLLGSRYPGGLPPAVGVLKGALSKITKPVKLLDVTLLSLLRKDGHPSIYGLDGPTGMDCSHWCLVIPLLTWQRFLVWFEGATEMVVAQFPVPHIRQSSLNNNKIEWW